MEGRGGKERGRKRKEERREREEERWEGNGRGRGSCHMVYHHFCIIKLHIIAVKPPPPHS